MKQKFKDWYCKYYFHARLALWLKYFGYDTGMCRKCGCVVQAKDVYQTQVRRERSHSINADGACNMGCC